MSPNDTNVDATRRPKKLICMLVTTLSTKGPALAPGDIAPTSEVETGTAETPESSAPQPQSAVPSHLNPEDIRSEISTPDSTAESQMLSHPARAHQFVTNPPLTISQMHGTNPLHQFHAWFRDPRLSPSSAPETCTLATAELPLGRVSARVVYLKELDERGWVVYSNWGSREGKGGQVFGRGAGGSNAPDSIPEPGDGTEAPGPGNKWGALTFCWSSVERQVRVEGIFEPLRREESELYWRTRERGSQIGAWASWQSRVLWSAEPAQLIVHQRRKSVLKLQASTESASGADVPVNIGDTDMNDGRALLEQRVQEMEAKFAGVEQIPLPPFWGGVRLVPESVEFWQGRRSRLHDRFRYVRIEGEGEDAQWQLQRLSP
ncbi:pyridoxamine phosphate oxidase [Penicillium capsulatum]|uniref:pyridoxal 5'-phosphate synthase n=1 Tax=Penicillium capsulatum TaxID=69766 RepID=A0A9W9LDW5_9EURO|nr:pyridoxamine phosphate oxidase [Penicillium capsulatum]